MKFVKVYPRMQNNDFCAIHMKFVSEILFVELGHGDGKARVPQFLGNKHGRCINIVRMRRHAVWLVEQATDTQGNQRGTINKVRMDVLKGNAAHHVRGINALAKMQKRFETLCGSCLWMRKKHCQQPEIRARMRYSKVTSARRRAPATPEARGM